jgi:hypothetical protein
LSAEARLRAKADATKQSSFLLFSSRGKKDGLLRFARNDGGGCVAGLYFLTRIASGVSGCASGCAVANSGNAIAVSKMRCTVG